MTLRPCAARRPHLRDASTRIIPAFSANPPAVINLRKLTLQRGIKVLLREIDLMVQAQGREPDPEDLTSSVPSGRMLVSRAGDIWCLGEHPETELPRWCLEYLEGAARKLNSLGLTDYSEEVGGKRRSTGASSPKANAVMRALGFPSVGKNAFLAAWSDNRKIRAAVQFRMLRDSGSSSADALKIVCEWLGLGGENQDLDGTKHIIADGEKLMRGET